MVGGCVHHEALHHALGMPLHAINGQGFVFERFDRAIRRARSHMQASAYAANRLMVKAVCGKLRAAQGAQPAAGCGADGVGRAVVAVQVLDEVAAKEYVQHLNAPADAERRFFQRAECL